MTYVRLKSWGVFSVCGWLAVGTAASGCNSDGMPGPDEQPTTSADSGSDGTGNTPADGTTGADGNTGSMDGASSGVVDDTTTADPTSDTTGEVGGVACLNDQYLNGPSPGPDYTEFNVPIGSHCQGTNQQDITGIERIVFVGDSVTVGTRPSTAGDFYRTKVAAELATHFGLTPPENLWNQANPITGTSVVKESGAFANCSEWGARNDDLINQLEDCFTPEQFALRTLVITTMGGNDASAIAQDAIAGVPANQLFDELEQMVANHEMAIHWLKEDPNKFPNGVFVVNANVYEYSDYTIDLLSCPAAGTVGFNMNPDNPVQLQSALNLINSEYMRIAEENGTDVVFMFESFCGHGYHAGDEASACYRGPGQDNWFDFTCIHPNPAGHDALAQAFINVIVE